MKTIGIKLADGSFYPVLEEDTPAEKVLELTTAHNNQTKVMVDLYRSRNCTMEDAEYVDSLQIESLNAHPNGEPTISFCVSIDEDNQLSARIKDPETGRESDTTITLVSRTVEERLVPDEYDISDSDIFNTAEEKDDNGAGAAAAAVAGVGLLGAAAIMNDKKEESEPEEIGDNDDISEDDNTEADNDMVNAADNMDFEDSFADIPDMPDMPEQTEEETSIDDSDLISPDSAEDFDLSEFDNDFDLGIPEEEPAVEESIDDSALEMPVEDEVLAEEDIPEEIDIPVEEDTPTEEVPTTDETIATDETVTTDETVATDIDQDLVNFEDTIPEETEEPETPDFSLDIPDDFDDDKSGEDLASDDKFFATNTDDFFNDDAFKETPVEENAIDDFDLDIPDEPELDSEPTPAQAGNLSFTGLYDKETEMGVSGSQEEDIKKKTKVPVIICIICAIICIIATLLILFVIPSKYNLINKAEKETVIEKPAEDVVEITPEPVPEAKEDEVIIVEKAEEVVPEQPEVAEEKLENISYKITWGDTLWDIADTYYKNPWRYKYIARYNGIKNPDHIVSGTYITIPAE